VPSFSSTLEQAIHAALALANERRHEFATLEHLLLALIEEPEAARVMRACGVELGQLRASLIEFVEEDLANLVTDVDGSEAVPTAAFQRVIQRAAIHVQSSGRTEVTGANVLVAIFAERESDAAYFLQDQDMTRIPPLANPARSPARPKAKMTPWALSLPAKATKKRARWINTASISTPNRAKATLTR
jgi:ATP-dependent Clp protease ATP-binding subunit ClpA